MRLPVPILGFLRSDTGPDGGDRPALRGPSAGYGGAERAALDLLAQVRADPSLRHLPVFLLVAENLDSNELEILARTVGRLATDNQVPTLAVSDLIRAALDKGTPVEAC